MANICHPQRLHRSNKTLPNANQIFLRTAAKLVLLLFKSNACQQTYKSYLPPAANILPL